MNLYGGIRALIAVAILSSLAGNSVADAELDQAFDRSSIVIEANRPACYEFEVWLALTPDQQRRGLMHVRQLPRFAGMLFVYDIEDRYSMWMKNTLIPLDILFIRGDGHVSSVAGMTEPLSLKSISAIEPVMYVLELNGGITAELDIGAGSVVHLPEF